MSIHAAMFKDTTMVSVELKCPGNRHKIEPDAIPLDADKEWIRASKLLLESPELKKIRSILSQIREWFKQRRVPGNFFRGGCYLIRRSLVPEVNAYLGERRAELAEAVEDFLAVYDTRKAQAMEKLEGLYDEADYPTPAQWRRGVAIVARFVSVQTDESLRMVDPVLYRQQCEQAEAEFARAVEEIRLALRQSLQQLLTHAVDRLTPADEGQVKLLREDTFNKLNDFLRFFGDRDITNDQQTAALVAQAKQVLENADIEKLKDDDAYRGDVLSQFTRLKTEIDAGVTTQINRLIEFEQAA